MYEKEILDIEEQLLPCILTEKQRYIYEQIRFKERLQKDIARELGISQPTVSKHYSLAQEKLNPVLAIIKRGIQKIADSY